MGLPQPSQRVLAARGRTIASSPVLSTDFPAICGRAMAVSANYFRSLRRLPPRAALGPRGLPMAPPWVRFRGGGVPEWSIGTVSKTVVPFTGYREFESLPLRQPTRSVSNQPSSTAPDRAKRRRVARRFKLKRRCAHSRRLCRHPANNLRGSRSKHWARYPRAFARQPRQGAGFSWRM